MLYGGMGHGSPSKCKLKPKPFSAKVSIEACVRFQSNDESTYTSSAFINALLEAWEVVRPCTSPNLARYLCVPVDALRGTVRCLTGMSYNDFRTALILGRYQYYHEQKLHLSNDEMAQKLGLYNRAGLLALLKRHHVTPYPSEFFKQKREKLVKLQKEIRRLKHELDED